jgi:regulator of protease activity HflC (stomatin/prohibitin superfamily)
MLLELLQAVTGVFVVVYDGQHGLKFTLGRARNVVGPGVHWKWPIFQKYEVRDTKHTTLDLEPQVIQLSDDLVYEIDCKVVYQIVDLRKAMIEIDDLVAGLRNRVVMSVQHAVQQQDRQSVKDTERLAQRVHVDLHPIELQWGVRVLQFGFSNISPSPATLEITQLDLLAREKLALYRMFRAEGMPDEAAVALISGAVIALEPEMHERTRKQLRAQENRQLSDLANAAEELREQEALRRRPPEPDPLGAPAEAESERGDDPPQGTRRAGGA